MSDPLQKSRLLCQAQFMLLKVQTRDLTRRATLVAIAVVLLAMTLAMTNAAIYFSLVERLDRPVAALAVAGINGILAIILLVIAKRTSSSGDAALVEEVRDLALTELKSDADQMLRSLQDVRADVQRIRHVMSDGMERGSVLSIVSRTIPVVELILAHLKSRKQK